MIKFSYNHWFHLEFLSNNNTLLGVNLSKVIYGYQKDEASEIIETQGYSLEIGILIAKLTVIL
jgi:hypothetical protein